MPKKREKIVVMDSGDGWWWKIRSRKVYGGCKPDYSRKGNAVRSAHAFAAQFINPPEVVVEES